ncbi:hypothetical protein BABINDRAFT_160769 [Babjeviella inositovora NRRL Y-12698]|uniref:Membrane protein TMS1 n=1 Tax=Babjeviella inositovora NRRL Y-12698 TaxID=984486 RepID=A0A1E3QS45_9ASCO|nr:uncharacterized protein BABINDRAFT_160769 [Babjeviella inositovora NRRL Y-12698]ODQ80490.1 hypothetical protein BABINDRAFT_160769 [Babjeviella inositovora NRRL Y-12698]
MGILLSLPITLATSLALCCGAATCSMFCLSLGGTFSSSILTRITYALIFVVNSVLSWVMLSPWVTRRLEKLSFGLVKFQCEGEQCSSFSSVHRVNLALGVFHLALALLLTNIRLTSNPRAVIQNGCWKVKIAAWWGFIVGMFLLPDAFFVWWGNHLAVVFSTVFLGIGLILLVDFAHEWAETCLVKIEEGEAAGEEPGLWKNLLVGGTLSMYAGTLILTGIMYWFFAGSGCSMNQAAITVNLILALAVSSTSIHPLIQEFNPQAGLAQAAMVCIYGSYLTMSAVAAEPDDKMCNPLVRSKGTRTASIVLGAFFTFVAIAYTTTRAAANSAFGDYTGEEASPGPITEQPVRNEMRIAAIQAAVNEGSLPESALTQAYLYDTDESREVDEERRGTKYNYALFHVIFFLATQYTATLLTMNVEQDDLGDFVPVGRTYFMAWVKIVSTWVCYLLFEWSLLAPALFPDRFAVQL